MIELFKPAPGPTLTAEDHCHFMVWAPLAKKIEVHLVEPADRLEPLTRGEHGYWRGTLEGVGAGALYFYRIDGEHERPDPASRHQPRGVHGPSEVVDPAFAWTDEAWKGLALADYVLYELHVGTCTTEGTFESLIARLGELKELGVTAIELMPVAQFPGSRNWGYDGVYPWAPQTSYGGSRGLRRLVDACHALGLAVVLDVVYNHLGPEGNYFHDYAPYFTDRYHTPWGSAINFDDRDSDEVRRYFIGNACYWIEEYHIDGLRLDALHAIFDRSARHFFGELAESVHALGERLGRRVHLFAETNLNDPRLVRAPEAGGYGLDAQWNDDFHHALHALLTGETGGYYAGFEHLEGLARAWREGYVFSGQYSTFWRRRHGMPAADLPARRFVVFVQNHDQIGNRMNGERMSALVPFEALKMAALAVLLSPYLPMLFMGEEWGELAPFLYFVSHGDPDLVEAVRKGRAEEFESFAWDATPPDPQAGETFERSRINPRLRRGGHHKALWELHRELLRLRREMPAIGRPEREWTEARADERARTLAIRQRAGEAEALLLFNFGEEAAELTCPPEGSWRRVIATADTRWAGPGIAAPERFSATERATVPLAAWGAAVYERESS